MTELHVLPVADLVDHEDNEGCVCAPHARFASGGVIYVHHALDGREQHEDQATYPKEP